MNSKLFLTILFFLLHHVAILQTSKINEREDELKTLLNKVRTEKSDSLRIVYNKEFTDLFYETLIHYKECMQFEFDSLNIGKPISDNGKIKFFSWNIQQNNGENIYSAIIFNCKSGDAYKLKNKKSSIELSDTHIFSNLDWGGGLCYRVISNKKNDSYTLLFWDGVNKSISRKYIDELYFDDSQPVFGKKIFTTPKGVLSRVIFQYSANSSFMLQSNKLGFRQTMLNKIKQMKYNSIIFDNLVPMNKNLSNQDWALITSGESYNCYYYKKGLWHYAEDIMPIIKERKIKNTTQPKHLNFNLLPK